MTPKNIHKIFIPQKIFSFLKTQKNIEIQNFEPKKMDRAYVCMKISEYPPGVGPTHVYDYISKYSQKCLHEDLLFGEMLRVRTLIRRRLVVGNISLK